MADHTWHDLLTRVHTWASENDLESYNYSSRYTYWTHALNAKVITEEEYQTAKKYYGNIWDYTGD